VTVHPLLDDAYVTEPVPEPPVALSVIAVPDTTMRVVLASESVACSAAHVNVTAELVLGAYVVPSTVEPALVAVTAQVPKLSRLTLAPVRSQPSVTVVNVTSPVPDPPLVVSESVVPVTTGSVDVDTDSGSCAVAKVNVTAVLVSSS
jgi:hypothetical protein